MIRPVPPPITYSQFAIARLLATFPIGPLRSARLPVAAMTESSASREWVRTRTHPSTSRAGSLGTIPRPPRFPRMRIREENCNMVLLAVVASFGVAIAGGATLLGFAGNKPVEFADRAADRVEQAPSPGKRIIYVNDQPQVRVIGAPFVPNTNPRER
jgi:hypothetical protein